MLSVLSILWSPFKVLVKFTIAISANLFATNFFAKPNVTIRDPWTASFIAATFIATSFSIESIRIFNVVIATIFTANVAITFHSSITTTINIAASKDTIYVKGANTITIAIIFSTAKQSLQKSTQASSQNTGRGFNGHDQFVAVHL